MIKANTILSANYYIDAIVTYLDYNTINTTHYRVIIVRDDNRSNFVLYTQNEALSNINDASVRKVFSLDNWIA